MGRSGTSVVAAGVVLALAGGAKAQVPEPGDYWRGFYLGIMGRTVVDTNSGDGGQSVGVVAGGGANNGTFYYGAEAQLAAGALDGGSPHLWLEADGRLGAQVTDTMLLFTSAGLAFDSSASDIALTAGAGAELDVADGLAVRAQYVLQHYPSGLGTYHGGQAGVVFRFD